MRVLITTSEEGAEDGATATATTSPIAGPGAPVVEALPTVSGTGLPGYTLTAQTGAWSGEADLFEYQWERCDEVGESCEAISGATSSDYTLSSGDAGSSIRLLLTASEAGTSTSAPSSPITISGAALAQLSEPSISGTDQPGDALIADPGLWTSSQGVTFAYQWESCDAGGESCSPITGATDSSYALSAADVGHTLRVKVTASSSGTADTAYSGPTAVIAAEPSAPRNADDPQIEGAPETGATLTAQTGTWLGSTPITFGFQWQRCDEEGSECAPIEGATGETYALGEEDTGAAVRVTITATNALGDAAVDSAPSEPISAPGPPEATTAPSVRGSGQDGEELVADNGTWSGSRPLKYFYRWERCEASGEACTGIEGASEAHYTVSSSDLGGSLRLRVTAENALGSASAVSAVVPVSPEGQASTADALELAEETDPSVLAPATLAELEGEQVRPALSDTGEAVSSTGALTSASISKETGGEFSVNTPVGELGFTPLGSPADATETPAIANGAAAIFADTAPSTDTFLRADPLGASALLQLRSAAAPTSFSWEVRLGTSQTLQLLPDGAVAVVEPTSLALEGPLSEEELKAPEAEPPGETSGEEGADGAASEEEFEATLEDDTPLEQLPPAPLVSTPESSPHEGELHPQDTQSQYEHATSAMESAEAEASGLTLAIIPPPIVMDADGNEVTATLSVQGNTVTMSVPRPSGTVFPQTARMSVGAPTNGVSASLAPTVRHGLSDQSPTAFTSSEETPPGGTPTTVAAFDEGLSGNLGVTSARLFIDYNTPPHSQLVDEWLKAVLKEGLTPFVTFTACFPQAANYKEQHEGKRRPCPSEPAIPKPSQYYARVKPLMKVLIADGVRSFGAWNEPNLRNNPLHTFARRAAVLWGEAQRASEDLGCRRFCKVVAGEFAAYTPYVGEYKAELLKLERNKTFPTRAKPSVWAMHDYNDLEHVRAEAVGGKQVLAKGYVNQEAARFVRAIRRGAYKPRFWLSEEGVEIESESPSGKTKLTDNAELQRIAALDFRSLGAGLGVEWSYYHGYRGPSAAEKASHKSTTRRPSFDSALLSGDGVEPEDWRPAYCVLALNLNGCPPTPHTGPSSPSPDPTVTDVVTNIDPQGLPTTSWISYGLTSAYGHQTEHLALANSNGEQATTVALSELAPCTTYHYRVEAESEADEWQPAAGSDRVFRSGGCAAIAVSAGSSSSCALLSSGTIMCWGANSYGELGDGTTSAKSYPVRVSGLTSAVGISDGNEHACAVLSGGEVKCWGRNMVGELGDGSLSARITPVAVNGIVDAIQVSASAYNTCALLSSGHVDCWGDNELGQLGTGEEEGPESCGEAGLACSKTPVEVSALTDAVGIATGYYGACALRAGGSVVCWGIGGGTIGDGSQAGSSTPVAVSGITEATQISDFGVSPCALLSSATIQCWGSNPDGELGDGTNTGPELCYGSPCSLVPVAVADITDATGVSSGDSSSCATLATGKVTCWGSNLAGQLGDGTTTSSTTPVAVSGIASATEVSSGGIHACALLADKNVSCWGFGLNGMLGDGQNENSSVPVAVNGLG